MESDDVKPRPPAERPATSAKDGIASIATLRLHAAPQGATRDNFPLIVAAGFNKATLRTEDGAFAWHVGIKGLQLQIVLKNAEIAPSDRLNVVHARYVVSETARRTGEAGAEFGGGVDASGAGPATLSVRASASGKLAFATETTKDGKREQVVYKVRAMQEGVWNIAACDPEDEVLAGQYLGGEALCTIFGSGADEPLSVTGWLIVKPADISFERLGKARGFWSFPKDDRNKDAFLKLLAAKALRMAGPLEGDLADESEFSISKAVLRW